MRPPRNSRFFCLILTFSIIPPFILIFSLLAYLNESMRPCVPFSLVRISKTAHQRLVCSSVLSRPLSSSSANLDGIMSGDLDIVEENGNRSGNGEGIVKEGRLAGFLASQRDLFLGDLEEGKGKGWTVVMGNEAGDLDSIASSIAYAQLSSSLLAQRTIPLTLTPSSLMKLRPENLLAFQMAQIPPSALLHPESLPIPTTELASLGVNFALVDHNRLLPAFGDNGEVLAIIDHHDDEGAHPNAPVREITVPTGSCSSLVVKHFRPQWEASLKAGGGPVPQELATLLLSAMLIDTGGLKSGGKATPVDYDSAAFLYPISTLSSSDSEVSATQTNTTLTSSSLEAQVPSTLANTAENLLETKMDVSGLSTYDLLLRDYKEYALPTSSSAYPTLKVGLSTVPLGLKKWLEKEEDGWQTLLSEVDQYMEAKTLDIEGILTTYRSEKKGKGKRELVIIVRSGGVIRDSAKAQQVLQDLGRGLEGSGELLALEEWDKGSWLKKFNKKRQLGGGEGENRWFKVWQQGNARSTRKQVAPLLRDLIAKLE
ncbi:hypothetical protein IAR55_005073 [Kwoniella newhampshirensis]|uniref:DHHA2 domain-containing protein n=1 Tax=Kwoniella newhampshirensis TaxID=1651941 RepID=A0AAW0YWL1_9TREE